MAKSPRRLAVMGNPDAQRYWRVEHLPWDEIERRTNLHFSTEDREEIYKCTCKAEIQRCAASGNVDRVKDVESYGQALKKHAEALIELAGPYAHNAGTFLGDKSEAQFLALSLAIRDPNFDLGQTLRQITEASEKLVTGLETIDFQGFKTERDPLVIELAHFIADVRQGATRAPARKNPGYLKEPTVFEYHRWGLHLSDENPQFAEFVSAILTRKVTCQQLQHALTAAKEMGLINRPE